jgi:N-acetylmuramic acid 6-phosphate etherase
MIAGGKEAVYRAVEGAEDNFKLCENDLKEIDFCDKDVLVGISASGRTPYVIGGLKYAKVLGAFCVSVTCNADSEMSKHSDVDVATVVGPEVITGSTRMKAGTAQKMVLNMLSTGAMIRYGKVYKNLMVDLKPANEKLIERAKKIVMTSTGCSYEVATKTFEQTNQNVKLAIVMIKKNMSLKEAKKYLSHNNGIIGRP